MSPAELLLVALLSLFRTNALAAHCIERNRASIIASADQAEREMGVPVGVLLAIAYLETHLGCTTGDGRANWGAPISASRRHTHGTAYHSAHALAWSFRVCGTWDRAVSRYRGGYCDHLPRGFRGYTPDYAISVVRRAYARAGLPLPDGLEAHARANP
ncbi:MAG TPA: hypothetical protein VHP62_08115 [Usitatibacter sp.]|nr:hypothetical protein [Usitatibacter sp.]